MADSDADSEEGADDTASGPHRDHFVEGTFNDWLGLELETYGDGEVVLSLACEDEMRNTGGTLHGGVTAALIDVAAGMAVASSFADAPPRMATTGLDVNYLRPITERASATGEAIRVGNSSAVARAEVESTAPDGERKVVAIGTVTFQRR